MAKSKTKRRARARSVKLASLRGNDGAHYTPLTGGKWLRSRRADDGTWRHTLAAKPDVALSGAQGPKLSSSVCPVDGCQYLNLGGGRYWQMCPNPDGTWSTGGVDVSQVPPSCR